jgi:serine protease DegQ
MSVRWLLIAIILFTPAAVHAQDKKKGKKKVEEKKVVAAESSFVPYRLTDTHHTLVRVKINGKGPFNFVVDTGCPVFLVSEPVGKKLGLDKGWVTLDKLELEGGLEMKNLKARIETPFQIEGMNGMGLAGVELHGLMGYTVLAKFKMDYDYNDLKMLWTPLKHEPLPPEMRGVFGFEMEEKDNEVRVAKVLPKSGAEKGGLQKGDRILSIDTKKVKTINEVRDLAGKTMAGKSIVMGIERDKEKKDLKMTAGADTGGGSAGMEMMVMMVRAMTWLLGVGPQPEPEPRGFFGFEIDQDGKVVQVARVLADSPAAKAGLKKGDRILSIESNEIKAISDVMERTKKITAGKALALTVERGKEKVELKITAGDGF